MEIFEKNLWVVLVISASFFNALWTSLTTNKDEEMSAVDFTVLFRLYTVIMMTPFAFFYLKWSHFKNLTFLAMALAYALAEGLRTIFIVKGAKEDYYATYAFVNMSPIVPLLVAPLFSNESLTFYVIAGTIVTIMGGLMFYKMGKVTMTGIYVAVIGGVGIIVSKIGVENGNGVSFPFVSFIMSVVVFTLIKYFMRGKNILESSIENLKNRKIMLPAFFSSIATVTYFTSLNMAPMTKVAPLMRFNLLFGFLLSYFMLKEVKDWKGKIIGGSLVLLGGVLVYAG